MVRKESRTPMQGGGWRAGRGHICSYRLPVRFPGRLAVLVGLFFRLAIMTPVIIPLVRFTQWLLFVGRRDQAVNRGAPVQQAAQGRAIPCQQCISLRDRKSVV